MMRRATVDRPTVRGEGRATPAPTTRRRRRTIRRVHPALFLFPVPVLVLYTIFFLIPTLQAFRFALTDWDGISAEFTEVGLDNFTHAATNDDLFSNALVNNLKFMFTVVVLQTSLSLLLAILLVRNSKSSVFLRALYFFPTILSSISVAFIWRFVYDPNVGLANGFLRFVGLDGLQSSYLGEPALAIYFVALTQVWFHAGQVMVIYIAGLQQIPADLTEAALMDGASRWQRFRHVTWPLIAPATAIVMAYTTLQSFAAFDLILGLDQNPPRWSLDILSTRIYTTFADGSFGYAAAQSVFFMLIIAMVVVLQRRAVRLTQQGG